MLCAIEIIASFKSSISAPNQPLLLLKYSKIGANASIDLLTPIDHSTPGALFGSKTATFSPNIIAASIIPLDILIIALLISPIEGPLLNIPLLLDRTS